MSAEPKIKALSERMLEYADACDLAPLTQDFTRTCAKQVAVLESENARLTGDALRWKETAENYIDAIQRLTDDLNRAEQQLAAERERFEKHTTAVSQFLSDMHATMIDPPAEGITPVDEMCKLLLKTAVEQREREDQLRREIASIREKARVCDCYGSRLTKYPKWENVKDPNCPHCTNGVRFDKKEN